MRGMKAAIVNKQLWLPLLDRSKKWNYKGFAKQPIEQGMQRQPKCLEETESWH